MSNIIELASQLSSQSNAIDFLIANGVISVPLCCEAPMRSDPKRPKIYICCKYPCRKKKSIVKDTFCGNSNLPVNTILLIAFLWCTGSTHSAIQQQTGVSKNTVTDWWQYCQELVGMTLENDKIGGPGIVVEIDESKFGKRKYNSGKRVEGVWVLGGVERTEERRMFAIAVEDRRKDTLTKFIKRYVKTGSHIITDCWRGYDTAALAKIGMQHSTVNHSVGFKDPLTGAHTNSIEGNWRGFKQQIPTQHYNTLFVNGGLDEVTWRRLNKGNEWPKFLEAIRDIRYY